MPREIWRQKLGKALRVGGATSIGLMPYTPLLSPEQVLALDQEQAAHTIFTELSSNQIPISWQEWNENEKTITIDSREQEKQSRVSVFGMVAEISTKGSLVLSLPMTVEKREITLPPVKQFLNGQAVLSPDGLKIGVVREFHDGKQFRYDTHLVWTQTSQVTPLLPDLINELPYTPLSVGFYWSSDGQKLAVTAGQHGAGRTIGIDVESGQRLFDLPGSIGGTFSPDGQWFARIHGETNLELIGPDGITKVLENAGQTYDWSPDSQSIAWIQCSRWQKLDCEDGTLALYSIKTDQSKLLTVASPHQSIIFSPDRNTIVYSQPGRSLEDRPAIFNLTTSQITKIDLISLGISAKDAYRWSRRFHQQGLVLTGKLSGDPATKLLWVDMSSGQVVIQQSLATPGDKQTYVYVIEIFNDKVLYQVDDEKDERSFYVAQITQQDGLLSGIQVGSVSLSHAFNSQEVSLFGLVQDGNYFTLKGQYFVYQNAQRYWMEHLETREYFGIKETTLPAVFAYSIPESETPLRFLSGDVITSPDWAPWYLRNGQRYRINNWDEFAKKQRFNRGIYKELPQWVLERIPVGTDPMADQARRYGGVIDWDGALKEHQPDGGRMIIFVGGYSGSSESQKEAFEKIKNKLRERGWNDRQFLEATYDLEILAKDRVRRVFYDSDDTKDHPLVSAAKMRIQLELYKQMFPKTKFILVGHSLGGFLAFNAALRHSEAIESVITLDSPLKGVGNSLLADIPYRNELLTFMGELVANYLLQLNADQEEQQRVENYATTLKTRGVKVFTFASEDDWLVRNGEAYLNGSDTIFDNHDVRLVWQLGHTTPMDLGDLISGHGQVLIDDEFLEELMKLFPSS